MTGAARRSASRSAEPAFGCRPVSASACPLLSRTRRPGTSSHVRRCARLWPTTCLMTHSAQVRTFSSVKASLVLPTCSRQKLDKRVPVHALQHNCFTSYTTTDLGHGLATCGCLNPHAPTTGAYPRRPSASRALLRTAVACPREDRPRPRKLARHRSRPSESTFHRARRAGGRSFRPRAEPRTCAPARVRGL